MLPVRDPDRTAPVFGDPWVAASPTDSIDRADLAPGCIVACVDRDGELPDVDTAAFDLLLTSAVDAPRPWVSIDRAQFERELEQLHRKVRAQPLASGTLAQVLRAGEHASFDDALAIESFAYSTLLGGPEFAGWRAANPARPAPPCTRPRIRLARRNCVAFIHLARPDRLNAFDARLRDELVEALRFVADEPEISALHLMADGRAFSSGGDLAEFGSAPDVATAHAIRCLRSPARLVHALRARTTAHLHGACIGAGIEVPAAAGRVIADEGTWFRLPEIGMGLIPGAGGTASLPRRIGRQRTLYMALTDRRIDTQTALAWGLVDELEARS